MALGYKYLAVAGGFSTHTLGFSFDFFFLCLYLATVTDFFAT